jgi:hypothetical protein
MVEKRLDSVTQKKTRLFFIGLLGVTVQLKVALFPSLQCLRLGIFKSREENTAQCYKRRCCHQ